VSDPSKPIDLIVSNALYHIIARWDALDAFIRGLGFSRAEVDAQMHKEIARKLLMDIATNASIAKVHAALKAVGAPCSSDDIKEGIQAVRDRVE
jgi:hypothetical protein